MHRAALQQKPGGMQASCVHLQDLKEGLTEKTDKLLTALQALCNRHRVPHEERLEVAQLVSEATMHVERSRNRAFKSALAIDGTLARLTEECDAVAQLGAPP